MKTGERISACSTFAWLAVACAACILLSAPDAGAAITVPEEGFAPGWVKPGPVLRFNDKNLFDYIDGGAELFLEFGFKELLVQRYTRAGAELTLEIYRMDSPAAALGIYLARSDAETPVTGIAARNTGSFQQVTALKGSVFLQVNNFEGGEESLPAMAALVNQTLRRIPAGKPVTLLAELPRKNLIPGSEALVRGQFGMQPIFTFGSGDVLLLRGKVFAVVGDYREDGAGPQAATYTRIIIMYPDRNAASQAYSNLVANLDSYLTVLKKKAPSAGSRGATGLEAGGRTSSATGREAGGRVSVPAGFTFRDYQGKYGSVELEGRIMSIKVNLSKEP